MFRRLIFLIYIYNYRFKGFLAQYVKGESLEKCIDCAIWAASVVIQQRGCNFPKEVDYV